EHHDLRAGLVFNRDVTGRRVERVARGELLITIGVSEHHAPGDDVAPMRALTSIVRQTLHERGAVYVLSELGEADPVTVHHFVAVDDGAVVTATGSAVLGHLRHRRASLGRACSLGRYADDSRSSRTARARIAGRWQRTSTPVT